MNKANEIEKLNHFYSELKIWCDKFNSGGTPHTDEEIERVKTMIKEIG